jgi:hypothetical protein
MPQDFYEFVKENLVNLKVLEGRTIRVCWNEPTLNKTVSIGTSVQYVPPGDCNDMEAVKLQIPHTWLPESHIDVLYLFWYKTQKPSPLEIVYKYLGFKTSAPCTVEFKR